MEARRRGLLLRPIGNVMVLMPPLSTSLPELRRMVEILQASIETVYPTPGVRRRVVKRREGVARCPTFARRTEEGMEADDLLCSRNARPRKALVGRAQWKINQPPSLEEITSKLGGSMYIVRCAQ